jgi:hypothetical protein
MYTIMHDFIGTLTKYALWLMQPSIFDASDDNKFNISIFDLLSVNVFISFRNNDSIKFDFHLESISVL